MTAAGAAGEPEVRRQSFSVLRWLGVAGLFALHFVFFYAAVFESFRSTSLYTQSGACADVGAGVDNCDWTFGEVTVQFAFLFGMATFIGAAIWVGTRKRRRHQLLFVGPAGGILLMVLNGIVWHVVNRAMAF